MLEGTVIRIGQNPGLPIRLQGTAVSREHAELILHGPVYLLRDLKSKNGTFVNGRRLISEPAESCPLRSGDVLRFGDVVGVVGVEPLGATNARFREVLPGLWGGHCLEQATRAVHEIAAHSIPVAVVGETGTGKEVVARAIHGLSGRTGPLHAISCAAIPVAFAETELFGSGRDAPTGPEGISAPGPAGIQLGHLRAAHRGTLLLDEPAELPLPVQAMLLRALEQGVVVPVGSTTVTPVDVRIVVMSQAPITEGVAAGRIRPDLAARLSGPVIEMPPLFTHPSDIYPLFCHFYHDESGGKAVTLSHRFVESLIRYSWPYNVRELRHLAGTLAAQYGKEPSLQQSMLPAYVRNHESVPSDSVRLSSSGSSEPQTDELKKLIDTLRLTNGNVKAAAEKLGISRASAYRLLDGRVAKDLIK